MTLRLRQLLMIVLASLVLAGCTSTGKRPDLARLYETQALDPAPPPVILIHGLMGSTLSFDTISEMSVAV